MNERRPWTRVDVVAISVPRGADLDPASAEPADPIRHELHGSS
ncbi:MAG: hypothetical protein ABWK00_00250 [Desulfurococcaceae archaeon]